MSAKNRYFCNVSQQVLSEVVALVIVTVIRVSQETFSAIYVACMKLSFQKYYLLIFRWIDGSFVQLQYSFFGCSLARSSLVPWVLRSFIRSFARYCLLTDTSCTLYAPSIQVITALTCCLFLFVFSPISKSCQVQ